MINGKICRLIFMILMAVSSKMLWKVVVMKLKVKNLMFLIKTLSKGLKESNNK